MKWFLTLIFLLTSFSAFSRPESCSADLVQIIVDELDQFKIPAHISCPNLKANASCPVSNSNCKFYECFNNLYPDCNKDNSVSNYAWSYGRFYCNKYRCITYDRFTDDSSKQWMQDVMQCLQESLEPFSHTGKYFSSCKELSDFAFDSHKPCYLGQGKKKKFASLCDLSTWNQIQVMRTVWKGVNSKKSLDQSVDVAANCATKIAAQTVATAVHHPLCAMMPAPLMESCITLYYQKDF